VWYNDLGTKLTNLLPNFVMKTLSATPRRYDRWKAEDLSFLHVLLVWLVALTSLLFKKRQSWTIQQKPSLPEISGTRP